MLTLRRDRFAVPITADRFVCRKCVMESQKGTEHGQADSSGPRVEAYRHCQHDLCRLYGSAQFACRSSHYILGQVHATSPHGRHWTPIALAVSSYDAIGV
jgi:hypothetical protein